MVMEKVQELLDPEETDEELLSRNCRTRFLFLENPRSSDGRYWNCQFLKYLEMLGHGEADRTLMTTARSASARFAENGQRPMNSCIMALQTGSRNLSRSALLPARYQAAIEKALKQTNEFVEVRSVRVNLDGLRAMFDEYNETPAGAQLGLGKKIVRGLDRFIERLNLGMRLFDEAESLEEEADDASTETTQESENFDRVIGKLKGIEHPATRLVRSEALENPFSIASALTWHTVGGGDRAHGTSSYQVHRAKPAPFHEGRRRSKGNRFSPWSRPGSRSPSNGFCGVSRGHGLLSRLDPSERRQQSAGEI